MFILVWGIDDRTPFSKNRETENNTVIVISDLRKHFIYYYTLF